MKAGVTDHILKLEAIVKNFSLDFGSVMTEDMLAVISARIMKLRSITWLIVVSLVLLQNASGQNFQNLDFESANLSPIPPGQYGSFVSISNALPGWTGYIGATQVTQALQNNLTVGSPSIDILGPNWIGFGLIEGQYTAVLQPADLGDAGSYSTSISQSGLVPVNALSLQFKAQIQTYSSFTVSLGGQTLSLVPLGTGSNYTLYGANISPFAGKVETLTITALAAPSTPEYFDSFVFSPSSVPEPSVFGLVDSSSKCDKLEEAAAVTFLFRRKPLLPMA